MSIRIRRALTLSCLIATTSLLTPALASPPDPPPELKGFLDEGVRTQNPAKRAAFLATLEYLARTMPDPGVLVPTLDLMLRTRWDKHGNELIPAEALETLKVVVRRAQEPGPMVRTMWRMLHNYQSQAVTSAVWEMVAGDLYRRFPEVAAEVVSTVARTNGFSLLDRARARKLAATMLREPKDAFQNAKDKHRKRKNRRKK